MPSAATAKLEKQASTEAPEPIRQAIIIIEHKIRNLEKRKRKIESYREEQKNGKDLNSDQLAAVAKYDEVLQTLDFARDLSKQFNGIAIDAAKQHKKQARKEALEKAQQEIAKVKEILMVQDVLQNMGQENVREDFLAGRNGAAQLTEDDLKYLDDLYSEVSPKHGCEDGSPPFQEQLQHSAEHLLSIVEGKTKDIVGTTYAKLKELVFTIHTCGYFDQTTEEAVIEQTEEQLVAVEGEVQNTQEGNEEEEYSAEEQQIVTAEDATFPQATQIPQTISAASQPAAAPNIPIPSAMIPQQNVTPVPTPVAAVESSYFSTAAPTFVPAQASNIQQTRPLNEVIGSVNSSFNFLQESELDSPDLSAMLSGAASQQSQARVQPTPPPSGPVAVAPIPSQTFTNQNFASATTASVVPQQVVYQPSSELPQSHIPGFATTPPNPPPPIPMPPSHHQHRSLSPATMQQTYSSQASAPQQVATYASQAQQQPQQQSNVVVPSSYSTQPPPQQQQQQQQSSQEQPELAQVSEPASTVPIDDANDDWGQTSDTQGDWSQQMESQGDWSQQTDSQNDWASSSSNQNDSFITQTSSRSYGGRGRMNRGGRGSSNGYSGGRGRGNYQNGRGGSGGGYGYRNNEGNNNYYQNGYQQRDNFGNNNYSGGYKRGARGGSGGAPRGGMERGGPRGGAGGRGNNASRGGNRGGGSSYVRGGGNKQ